MGIELRKAGFTSIAGVDASGEMLRVCGTKEEGGVKVYDKLVQCLIGDEDVALEEGAFDVALSSACMIKGHLPNTCYSVFCKHLKDGGHMVFSIRDIYLNSETDSGMNYHGALEQLQNEKKIEKVEQIRYTKYEGLQFGTGYQEEGANIMVFKKLA